MTKFSIYENVVYCLSRKVKVPARRAVFILARAPRAISLGCFLQPDTFVNEQEAQICAKRSKPLFKRRCCIINHAHEFILLKQRYESR